jgi:hypothetical protein
MTRKAFLYILPNIDTLYQDSDCCCDNGYGDEIGNNSPWLGPRFSLVVPGIQEWLRRYENATDFANITTDPSFDWATWHYEGLCFAKAVWEQLPRCYTLYYVPPFEDCSGIIGKLKIDDTVDYLIDRLSSMANKKSAALSFKDNIEYGINRKEDGLDVTFRINKLVFNMSLTFDCLTDVKHWLEDIIKEEEGVCSVWIQGHYLHYSHQTVGFHPEMGQFWISKDYPYDNKFNAYVDTKEFVSALYLSLMTKLGFSLYDGINNYPTGEELRAKWKPYNDLKSCKVEAFITGQEIPEADSQTYVTESFVIFPDWGGCIFWDTMGVGSGEYDTLYSDVGDFTIDVPGLQKWSDFYDDHDDSQTYEEWWREGWELAKQIRRQLPNSIDLYYMCFDTKQPDKLVGYRDNLPKIIVPTIYD